MISFVVSIKCGLSAIIFGFGGDTIITTIVAIRLNIKFLIVKFGSGRHGVNYCSSFKVNVA